MTTEAIACRSGEPVWVNWARNQEVHARCTLQPKNLEELVEVVRAVSESGSRMRAVATGLSFSDILQTDDTLVILTDLTQDAPDGALLPLEAELWRNPNPEEPRVRIICGASIRKLNAALERAGLAFSNLGGFDFQTFIGALSTSTHGSGAHLGPLCDAVRSIDLVAAFGKRYRIEPTAGITDPTLFAKRYGDAMTLVQNDQWFYSTVVSLGCMGVVYSVVAAVRPAYDLVEHRWIDTWSNVRAGIVARKVSIPRHYEAFINPYPRHDGEYPCIVTERRFARPGQERVPLPEIRQVAEDLTFKPSTQHGIVELMHNQPRLIPLMLQTGFELLSTGRDGHIDKSQVILNVGKINYAEVLAGEYIMPLAGNAFVLGIDRLLRIVRENAKRGLHQTAPLSMRFVQGSPAYLSMVHGVGQTFGSVEIAMFAHMPGAAEVLLSYEQAMYEFRCRPHWGQLHELTGTRGWANAAYPELGRWREVRKVLDCRGTFDNHFTDRLGISAGCP